MLRAIATWGAVTIVASLAAAPAWGEPTSSAGAQPNTMKSSLFQHAVSESALEARRGRALDLRITEVTERGAVSENAAHHLTTGSNIVSDGAFANSAGVPIVVQNSGNNVLIQNSTVLNLNVK
jgi:hypothetical protein